jgi:dihydrofolate reductase
MINLIWAMTKDNLIGKGNLMPWHIKEDLVYYKNRTAGKTVLMGEETYYSLKGYYKTKPLPYGTIYVASLNTDLTLEDATVVNDVISFVKDFKDELWVVGGATIYKLTLPYADNLFISFVKGNYEGDKYFPQINYDEFKLVWDNETDLVHYTQYERV